MSDELHDQDAPILVRVGGLPASILEIFSRSWSASWQEDLVAESEKLETSRSALNARLYAAIGDAPSGSRGFLLQVKRDCFNRRDLSHHLDDPRWQAVGGPPEELLHAVEQDRALARATGAFDTAYRKRRHREVQELLEIAERPSFRRGLALASPLLLAKLPRLGRMETDSWSRRERKLASSLARYVTRSAAKLSPYSTFTRVALGTARSTPGVGIPSLRAGLSCPWRERSLVRVKRYRLNRLSDLITARMTARDRWTVRWNDTLRRTGDGRHRWLRPGAWSLDEETGEPRFRRPALAGARLDGPLIELTQELLVERERSWGQLVGDLESALEAPRDQIAENLDRLLGIGALVFLPPWRPDEGRAELALQERLGEVAGFDPDLHEACEALDRLVRLQDDFAEVEDPLPAVKRMTASLRELEDEAVGAGSEQRGPRVHDLFEDVFLMPGAESADRPGEDSVALFEVSLESAREAVNSLAPWMRLLQLFGLRLELLHTFSAFLGHHAPGGEEIPLLEAFEAFQPHWKELSRVARSGPAGAATEDWQVRFDPFDLPILKELQGHRQRVRQALKSRYLPVAEDPERAFEALEELAAELPSGWSGPFGPCLFLQPTGAADPAWVLNRLFEGTGRYGSRFTAAMDERSRRAYTSRFRKHACFEWCGDRVELLDLMCVAGDTLNVHSVQTPWVLKLPGERAAGQGKVASLADLRIGSFPVDSNVRLPRLRHVSGTLLWPVYLGGSARAYTQPVVQFLSLLGQDEVPSLLPPQLWREVGEARIRPRQSVGNVVVHRQAWAFPVAPLRQRLQGLDDAGAFLAMQRWRREWALPERVFFIDKVQHPSGRAAFKPQLVDFSSPLLVSLLVSAVTAESADPTLTVEEMLPDPKDWPVDPGRDRWAAEAQIDSLSLVRPGPAADPGSSIPDLLSKPAHMDVSLSLM